MKIKLCDKCRGTNVNTLISKIQKIIPDVEFDIRCHNMCGIGRTQPFVIINHIPVIATTEEELVEKIKEMIAEKS